MANKHQGKVVAGAMRRLREIANTRTVRDANGKVLFEGYPAPEHIEHELNMIYRFARAKAKKEANSVA